MVLTALSVLTTLALAVLAAAPAGAVTEIQLSSDPYTNSTSQHQTELEPDTFAFGSTIVAAFQVGRFFNGGASNIGWATSTNGGTTWSYGFLPGITIFQGGGYDRASDPTVAYDAAHGVWMISSLGIITGGDPPGPVHVDVLVSRSTNGTTWDNPVPVAIGDPKSFLDKNWTACDNTSTSPFYGHCYTEFDDNGRGNLLQMSTSTDGGLLWGAALPTQNQTKVVLGGQPVVLPDGTAVVPILQFTGHGMRMISFISTDGGSSWSKTVKIDRVDYHRPAGGIRAGFPLPSVEVDASGTIEMAWPDCRFEAGCAENDMVLTNSTDGLHWSPVTLVPTDPLGSGADHFIPGLAASPTDAGHLALAYYSYPDGNCTDSTCQLEADLVTSDDGGSNWTAPQQLTPSSISLLWLPNTTQGTMVGDYISTSFSSSTALPVYADAQAPSGGLFQEAAYTAPVVVTRPHGPTRSGVGIRPVATSAYFPTGRWTSN